MVKMSYKQKFINSFFFLEGTKSNLSRKRSLQTEMGSYASSPTAAASPATEEHDNVA